MVPLAKLFFFFKLLDTCELLDVGVTVDMREAPDGSCAATVSYLTPARDVYYSAVELGGENGSLTTLTSLSPALEFVEPGEASDGWLFSESVYLEFETSFAPRQFLEIDAARCTCR